MSFVSYLKLMFMLKFMLFQPLARRKGQGIQPGSPDGMLERDTVELFESSKVYQKVLDTDWREF